MTLATVPQQDWAAGMFRGFARHMIPPNGCYDAKNCLLDDDGLIKERGGVVDLTTSGLSSSALTFLWAGHLGPGERIVFADGSNFAVASGALAPITLGGGGLSEPKRAVEVGGLLLIGGGTVYGGSLKSADYSGVTIGVTNGSKTVTKASGFTANVDAGMLLRIGGAGRYYIVASVDSDTQITLRDNYQGSTNATATGTFSRLGTASAGGYKVSDFYAHAADRALAAIGKQIFFSDVTVPDPAQATSGQGPHVWNATDYHELPEGAQVLGVWDVGPLAIVFSTKGAFVIRNLALDLTDAAGNPQQQLDHFAPQLVLWGNPGIASYFSSLVVPALDGVYLIDGISSPVPLSFSIPGLYRSYIEAGHKPGLASVFRGHYFLPVLTAGGQHVDLLVCRLDRPVWRGRHLPWLYPWTRMTGFGAQVTALSQRVLTPVPTPQLLGASNTTRSRVEDLTGFFNPGVANKNDADGTTPIWELVTRDYPIGNTPTQTKRLRIDYELDDAASDNPTINAGYNVGEPTPQGSAWGVAHWGSDPWTDASAGDFIAIPGSAPEDPEGDTPYEGFTPNVRAKRIRFRFQCTQPNSTLRFRGLELFIRPNRKT